MVAYDRGPFVKAHGWTRKSIFWLKDPTVHKGRVEGPKASISLHFNVADKILMYTVLDSKTLLPRKRDDWAKFLPVYLQCREFF